MGKRTRLDWFDRANYAFFIFFGVLTVYPLVFVLAGSFNEGLDYLRGGVFLVPRAPTFANYALIFQDDRLLIGYRNTLLRTVVGTLTSVLFTTMVAYGMSRRHLRFRNVYWWINLFTLFFGGGLIPYFLVLKGLGFINNFAVYLVPALYSVFNMIILQNFLQAIPEEMHESAAIEGAGDFRILFQFFLPLSTPVLATIALWNAVWHWNSFFDSMVFTVSPRLMTLQLYLMKLIKESSSVQDMMGRIPSSVTRQMKYTAETIRLAAIVVSLAPIVAVYPFIQKYFMKGIMIGALKG